MNKFLLAAALLGCTTLAGCVAPVGPVQVTRFHVPDATVLGHGAISVVAAPGEDPASLELRAYQAAVARQLLLAGYSEALPGSTPAQVAEVRVRRQTFQPERSNGPVSVGVGGSTGSYGSGLGLGIGIDLSGKPPAQTQTELAVQIKDKATGKPLWEGRANFTVRADSPMAGTPLGAAKLAEALFKGFPGNSGETIEVP